MADIIFPILNISDDVLRVILVGLVILFPIWIIFAYFFEWTEHGFKLTSRVEEEDSISETTSRRLNIYIIGGLTIAVVLLLTDRFTNFTGTLPEIQKERSIAVLPFDNLGDPETAYFAEGMAEDILTQLSKAANLRVLSRVTLKGYDMTDKTVEEIGEDLGVNYLLTGSVRKANDQVRVSCQLVQVNPEEQAWAESFDRQLYDIFRIQSEVAQNIARQLQASLSPEEQKRIELEPTKNLEAYTTYLKGREAYNKYQTDEMQNALNLFKEAIEIDPKLAPAHAGVSDAIGQLTYSGILPNDYYDSAKSAAEKALEINPELAEGWKALGLFHHYSGDIVNAKDCYEKALEYNPNFHAAVANLVGIYGRLGDIDKAMNTAKKSMQLDPLNSFSYGMIARGLLLIELYDSAEVVIKRGLEFNPGYIDGYNILSEIYASQDKNSLAKEMFDQKLTIDSADRYKLINASVALRFDPDLSRNYLIMIPDLEKSIGVNNGGAHSLLGYLINDPDSAQLWIDAGINFYQDIEKKGLLPADRYDELMALYALNGQEVQALEAFQVMINGGFIYAAYLRQDPRFDNLRDNPIFIERLEEIEKKNMEMRLWVSAQKSRSGA